MTFGVSFFRLGNVTEKTNTYIFNSATDTKEEDLTHPEDIAHFKKHDMEADEDERQQRLDRMPIVEQNIPQKFRRSP